MSYYLNYKCSGNITIKLGYANAKVYRVAPEFDDKIEPMARYCSMGSAQPDEWDGEVDGMYFVL